MHKNTKCNGIELPKCEEYSLENCNFCIEDGRIKVIKEDETRVPLSKGRELGKGVNGIVYLFKSDDGEHELAVKKIKDPNDDNEIKMSKKLAGYPDEIRQYIIPTIFTREEIDGLETGIKTIMPRCISLGDKAREMSIANISDRQKIVMIIKIFEKLCKVTSILAPNNDLFYSDQKLANFLMDKDENIYFGDIETFGTGASNDRNQPHQIFEDFCQVAFNGKFTYSRGSDPKIKKNDLANLINNLYLSVGVRDLVGEVKRRRIQFCDINDALLERFIESFNNELLISEDDNQLTEEEVRQINEISDAFDTKISPSRLSIYINLKQTILSIHEALRELQKYADQEYSKDSNIIKLLQDNRDDPRQFIRIFRSHVDLFWEITTNKDIFFSSITGNDITAEELITEELELFGRLFEILNQKQSSLSQVQEVLDNEIQGYLSWMDHYRSLNITPEFINVLKTRIPRGDSDKQLELKQLILNLIPDDILSGEIVAEVQPTVAEVPEEQQKVAAAEAKAPEEQPDEFQQFKIIYRDTIIDLGKKIEDIERRLSAIETNEDIAGGNLDINQNNSIYKVMYTKIKE